MSKIMTLIKNEYIKEFSKKSIFVILAICVAMAVAMPILNNIEMGGNELAYLEDHIKWNEEYVEELREDVKRDKSLIPLLAQEEIEVETFKLQLQNEISSSDGRYSLLMMFEQMRTEQRALELLLAGEANYEDIRDNMYMLDNFQELGEEAMRTRLNELDTTVPQFRQAIADNDIPYLMKMSLQDAQSREAASKQALDDARALARENPNDAEYQANVDYSENMYNIARETTGLEQLRLDRGIGFDRDDYKVRSIDEIKGQLEYKYQTPYSEAEFLAAQREGYFPNSMTYEKYEQDLADSIQEAVEEIAVLRYGIDNDIPPIYTSKDARSLAMTLTSTIPILSMLIVIIGGSIVSREYSTGSIRLLLTRPVKRWKVYTAKFATVITLALATYVVMFIAAVITSGFISGFGGYGTPILSYVNGAVVRQNFWVYAIPQFAFAFIAVLTIGTIAFSFSAMTRNTAVSVALPLAGYFSCSLIFELLALLKFTAVRFTPFPYMQLQNFVGESGQHYVAGVLDYYNITLYPAYGAILLLACAALFFIGGLWVFNRRDVTN